MTSALAQADPFAIALWTLIVCGFVFLVYLTIALGRFLHALDDIRTKAEVLAAEMSAAARALREHLAERAPAAKPAATLPPPIGAPPAPAHPEAPAGPPMPPTPQAAPTATAPIQPELLVPPSAETERVP